MDQSSFCSTRTSYTMWKLVDVLGNFNANTTKLFLLLCLKTLEQEEKDNEAVSKMMALDQKNQLLNLFHEKNRPTLAKWPQVHTNQTAPSLCIGCVGSNHRERPLLIGQMFMLQEQKVNAQTFFPFPDFFLPTDLLFHLLRLPC